MYNLQSSSTVVKHHLKIHISILQYVPYAVIRLLSSSQKSNRFLAIINLRSIRYLKERALIHISMSIIEKVFKYKETKLFQSLSVKMTYGSEVRP